ncbi:hypothetical protein DXG03_007083 [Asterophora parasitica]|uniref:N-alpha-acetyltransferase 40 n=1 Tax=Asterophora parasitica TaxID=117018 RepID=A0A9P7GG79_9AGAR|nr:hypothetical protein DXG03_007083 [Asterophora parasitica]
MPISSLVRKANKGLGWLAARAGSTYRVRLPDAQFDAYDAYDDIRYTLRVFLSAELNQAQKDVVWTIFEDNMRDLYTNSSFGWDPPSKLEELFNKLSRFVLVETNDHTIVAFAMFRFEHEEDEDVLYCYDLQIHQSQRRTGLGTLLVQALEAIGTAWRMEKIMLTVFKANANAIKFYEAAGLAMDESSPNYLHEGETPDELEVVDYDILSKPLFLP